MEAARAVEGDIEPSLLLQVTREPGPAVRRASRPRRVFRHAEPFALHPAQGEIAARGAIGDIALVEHGDALTGTRQAQSDRRAHESAADHGDVAFSAAAHSPELCPRPTKSRSRP